MRALSWSGAVLLAAVVAPASARPGDLADVRAATPARAASANECRVIDLELEPVPGLQIVAWIETAAGDYLDTIYITHAVGTFGIGNRAGVFGTRSGPRWPYGPRTDVFPVWSHRHGLTWPVVHFQNGDGNPGGPLDCAPPDTACLNDADRNLSHPFNESSREVHFLRPVRPDEQAWDTGTTASMVFTDKGKFSLTDTTRYPPRADVERADGLDHDDVALFAATNPFDAVSQATPPGDQPFRYTWLIPTELYDGGPPRDYVMLVEVAREFDYNATYNDQTQPPTTASGWNEYGLPYRGQPSIVYRVPFSIGPQESREGAATYHGYGDPLGKDGAIRPPDATITDDPAQPGVGAHRLVVVDDPVTGGRYHVRVDARFEIDELAPGRVDAMAVVAVDDRSARVSFVAPGDDGMVGRATGYDVRYRVGGQVTLENFGTSTRMFAAVEPVLPGTQQVIEIDSLLPLTTYHVGIRAFDSCRNYSPLTTITFTTLDRPRGQVDACFVATAAYGSAMANDVAMLRRLRDGLLRHSVFGELAVETYYTFGPALAGVVGESELLRATARAALEPVVGWTRGLVVTE